VVGPIAATGDVRSPATGRKARGWVIGLRLLVVIGGGYAASSVLVAGLARALVPLGLARSDGVLLASMLGFVIYLLVLILGFSRRRLMRVVLDLLLIAGFGLVLAAWAGA
jgi:hypothetical protein